MITTKARRKKVENNRRFRRLRRFEIQFFICAICIAIFKLLVFLTSCDAGKRNVPFRQTPQQCRKVLDSKPPTGGVPCPGGGGSWGRNQRLGERKSGFRPRQIFLVRAAVLILRAGV